MPRGKSGREKRQNMCPNNDCADFGDKTTLMGGCGTCGTALVPWKPEEPTNEQLEHMMISFGLPVIPGMADRQPQFREGMLNFHRLVQDGLNGDDAAMERVQFLIDAFKRTAA